MLTHYNTFFSFVFLGALSFLFSFIYRGWNNGPLFATVCNFFFLNVINDYSSKKNQ